MLTNLLANAGENNLDQIYLLGLAIILIAISFGKELLERLKQSTILGFICGGILIGNAHLINIHYFDFISKNQVLDVFSQMAVIILMFKVGLESSVGQMITVGPRATIAAILGLSASIVLGTLAAHLTNPEMNNIAKCFIGVALGSTSVSIGACVLDEFKARKTETGRLIIGAGIIDDILGLVALALISNIIENTGKDKPIAFESIGIILLKAFGFLAVSMLIGRWVSKKMFKLASYLQSKNNLLTYAFILCIFMSWLATLFGLAAMIGAFAAGLVLEEIHYRDVALKEEVSDLDHLMHPLETIFVPFFFGIVGTRVDLSVFANPTTVKMALFFFLAAVVGKMACALATIGSKANGLAVAFGMVPRAEVVIIIAAEGAHKLSINNQPVVSSQALSAIIVVVVLTTLFSPIALKQVISKITRD